MTSSKSCNINPRATTAVLVSRNTLYNAGDINTIIDAMTYSGFDKRGVLIANNEVINGSEQNQSFLLPLFRDQLERFIVLESRRKVGINDVEIQSIALGPEDSGIGFKIFAHEFTICYVPTNNYSPEVEEQCKNTNILILEAPNETSYRKKAIRLIQNIKPQLAILTSFGIKMIEADPLYEAREIHKQTGVQTIAAKDGMVLNPLSYSANLGQKTLQGF